MSERRTGLVLFAGSAAVFSALFLRWSWFVLDDAFIAFRYAGHLARYGQLAWNVGQDPVEGYSSFLWVLLEAGAMRLGAEPVGFAKTISFLASLALIALLVRVTAGLALAWRGAIVAAGAASPALALLAAQGMETALTCLLVLATALLAGRSVSVRSVRSFLLLHAAAFVAALARPDTLVFGLGALAGVAWCVRRDAGALRRLVLAGLPFVVLGVAYMSWRYRYFGYWLPNPARVKLHGTPSPEYPVSFLLRVLLPYVVLLGAIRAPRFAPGTLPTLLGCLLFFAYLFAIDPIQGHLWRYGFPCVAPLLFAVAVHMRSRPDLFARPGPRLLQVAVVVLGLAWPLHNLRLADWEARRHTPVDRVLMGQALRGLDGSMYTTESGALAYYSGWWVVDHLGLNSEEIARRTASRRALLEELEPEVVALMVNATYPEDDLREVVRYLRDRRYVPVAAVHKWVRQHHVYLVSPASARFDEIRRRIAGLEGVAYRDPEAILATYPEWSGTPSP